MPMYFPVKLVVTAFLVGTSMATADRYQYEGDEQRVLRHRRLDRMKLEVDPRGWHRQSLLGEHRRRVLSEGWTINEDYEERRKMHSDVEIAKVNTEKRQETSRRMTEILSGNIKKEMVNEEMEDFWERFVKTGGSSVSTSKPTRAPTTRSPRTRRPTSSPVERVDPTQAPIEPEVLPTLAPVPIVSPTAAPVAVAPPSTFPVALTSPTFTPIDTLAPSEMSVVTTSPTGTPMKTSSPSAAPVETDAPVVAPVQASPFPTVTSTAPPVEIVNPTATPAAITPVPSLSRVARLILSVALFGGGEFVDPASYQSQALVWLEGSSTDGLSDARIIQRYSLACIYFATFQVATIFTDDRFGVGNVPTWQTSTNWVTDVNECEWARIDCNADNEVTVIDLFSNIVTGEFPPEVVYLNATLEILDLGNNLVFSNATTFNPYLGELTELTDLRTDRTNFLSTDGIPTQLANLRKLSYYSCEGSLYRGPLNGAAFPSDLAALSVLDIEANGYEGSTVPSEIGLLPALENFYIRASDVGGTIDYMANMQSIFQTFVDLNPQLGGTMPTELGTLSTLASFSATECAFSGTLPSQIGNLGGTVLNMFFYNNSFTGTIPTEWGSLTAMEELQIQVNDLQGEIPPQICTLTLAALTVLTADCDNCPATACCTQCF